MNNQAERVEVGGHAPGWVKWIGDSSEAWVRADGHQYAEMTYEAACIPHPDLSEIAFTPIRELDADLRETAPEGATHLAHYTDS